ncbi:hypothetical protein BD626DRAFT_582262 [Schizophyllum amplum]|uniref:Uncharacterized protein n=1 Tax=Schizophyllum amplum TaxID=97359 RepID=A0A550CNK7_9AGAR|nr:hypothetical protein BD626DRAFT_582262 [Auriculariopsis ampla]
MSSFDSRKGIPTSGCCYSPEDVALTMYYGCCDSVVKDALRTAGPKQRLWRDSLGREEARRARNCTKGSPGDDPNMFFDIYHTALWHAVATHINNLEILLSSSKSEYEVFVRRAVASLIDLRQGGSGNTHQ